MTPINILKIKKGISIVLMVFGLVLITQGWFPKRKKWLKMLLIKSINKTNICVIICKPLNLSGFFDFYFQ
jgi:hypothetical protein